MPPRRPHGRLGDPPHPSCGRTPKAVRRGGYLLDAEFDVNLIFHLHHAAADRHRLDAEFGLLESRRSPVGAVRESYVDGDRMRLSVQGEISADGPVIGTGGFMIGATWVIL